MDQTTPPYSTGQRQLAYALANAGVRFAPQTPECGGPAQNLYTVGFLRDRKIGVGKDIEVGVQLCVKHKIPGAVTYFFERGETLNRAIAAWDQMHEEWEKAHEENREPMTPDISPETVMQVLFVYFNQLDKLAEVPWFNKPLCSNATVKTHEEKIKATDGKHDFKPGNRSVTTGAGKMWTLGDKEARRHLKV